MKTTTPQSTRRSFAVPAIAGIAMAGIASAQLITQDFESTTAPDVPTGWTTVGVGVDGTYATTAGTGNPGQSGNLDWTGSNTTAPSVYLVNSGAAFDTARPISGTFDFYVTEDGNYSFGNFVFGDVLDGLTNTSGGEFLNVQLQEQTFGSRARLFDGANNQLVNTDGNNNYQIATNTWYTATFTWTPTGGTTGDFTFSWGSEPGFSITGYTFNSNAAHFGFGTGDSPTNFDNISITGTSFTGSYWDTNGTSPGAGNPASGIWDGSITNWNPSADGTATTAAWTPGTLAVFAAGDDATDPYTVTASGTQDISGLIFEDGTPTLTGGTLRLTADSYTIVKPGISATVASAITDDGGTRALVTGGEGTLILSGNNSGAATTSTSIGGITQFNAPNSIPGTGENLTINAGGVLAFGGSFDATSIQTALNDRVVTTSAGTIAVDGNTAVDFDFATAGLTAAYLGAIGDTTYTGLLTPEGVTYRLGGGTGKLTLNNTSGMDEASPTIQVLGNVEISGNIAGATGTFTKQNTGTLILSGANTYTANTTASGGTLVLAGSNNQATQTTINAATVQLASNSNGGLASGVISFSQNAAVLQAVDEDRAIANEVLLNASPTISGPQSLTISGALTTNNANRTLNNNIVTGESLTLAGQINLSNNDTGRTLTIKSGATSSDVGIGTTFITGNIVDGGAGAGGLTLTSNWRESQPFYLSGTNTYSGLSEFQNGLVTIQGKQALSPNTTVRLNHTSGSNGQIALLDDGSGNISLPNTFQTYTNNSTGNHSIFVGNNNTANGGTSSGTTTGSTFVIPTLDFNFIKADTQYSSVNITGANDYSLRIDSVVLNNANARNAANTWQARFNPTTASVSLGNITMPDGNNEKGIPFLQLEGSATGNVVTGAITEASDALGTGQPLSLNKTGTSEWTLEGANAYTGATTITGGLLVVNGSLDPASAVAVNGGTLGGSGTIGGSVTVAAAANLAPGESVGTLSIGGGLDISALAGGAGLLDYELGPIASSDKIAVSGTLTIGGGALGLGDFNLTNVGGLEEGVYTLITSGGISGTLDAGDLEGDINGTDITLGTSGGNIILTVGTPSGTPYELWLAGAGADEDTNGDGVDNAVAWALGAADPDENAIGLLPILDNTTDPTDLIFTFNRSDAAEADANTTITVEYGNDLVGWTTAVDDNDNVEIEITDGTPKDTVVVKLKRSTLGAGGKLFARLNVVVTP
ncbi:MAG TPA: autotransporter-associated beta strand repeat-containing protein [Luteolibacter sp.]|nr:autotransporter-associated beta strand repeat-containing protein [Luteolibacter sp.]